MANRDDSCILFDNLSSKITQLLYGRSKNDRILISKTLDDLNTINYKYGVVTNSTRAVLLINQCCSLILSEDLELVLKCCQLITNLVKKQSVSVEGRTLIIAVQWCLSALNGSHSDIDVLVALDALLRNNSNLELLGEIMKCAFFMASAKSFIKPELSLYALQCLEACTGLPEDLKTSPASNFYTELSDCFQTFLMHLWNPNFTPESLPPLKVRIVCLRGLQNLIVQDPSLLEGKIGNILGIIKSYMLLGIKNIEFIAPQKLMPSALSIPEPSPNLIREQSGGKVTKHRKYRTQNTANKVNKRETWNDVDGGPSGSGGYSPATSVNLGPEDCQFSSTTRFKTSDSDYSDSEAGNAARLRVILGRVRQDALALFFRVVKVIKNSMFSYWSNFIPENPATTKHNLMACILKDPTTKGRMGALNVLLLLLATSKLYLAQAEKGDNLSFTPYSVALGLMIKELHKCLCLALNEHSIPVLNMVLKCLASLVQATPYHRLDPGLIVKIVRNVKFFIYHKDPTVQVTAMIVLGCILATEPSIAETKDCFTKSDTKQYFKKTSVANTSEDSIEFADFSSEDSEQETSTESGNIPWVLARCIQILGVKVEGLEVEETTSMAVKLEAIQIISAMSKHYFESMMVPHLGLITKALDTALSDKYMDVRFHGGRGVDFIGHAINRSLSQTEKSFLSLDQSLHFWQTLLNGSLPSILQDEQHPILRLTGCDCLSSINGNIFGQLPREKQIFCITMLFACSRDEEGTVKGAAVRALAICVLHPTLREDLGFVIDTAEAILRVLEDQNVAVKTKCSWALGNLCEAIVLNKSNPNLKEELPRSFLLKLFNGTVKASNEGLKVRINTVRALGHILQLIDDHSIHDQDFKKAIKESMNLLVDSCSKSPNMKVRWNSCHALGCAMNNPTLFASDINWQEKVFNTLSDLVVNYRNFKVRINAASALASPKKREYYQQHYVSVFISLVKGLGTSQNMEDFSEYKHRDHLIEQTCLTLGYLATMLKTDDLSALRDAIYSEHLQQHMKRLWDKLLPEKSTVLFDAQSHVSRLLAETDINNEQKTVLQYLNDILTQTY